MLVGCLDDILLSGPGYQSGERQQEVWGLAPCVSFLHLRRKCLQQNKVLPHPTADISQGSLCHRASISL